MERPSEIIITLEAEAWDTVGQLKLRLQGKGCPPAEDQSILFLRAGWQDTGRLQHRQGEHPARVQGVEAQATRADILTQQSMSQDVLYLLDSMCLCG